MYGGMKLVYFVILSSYFVIIMFIHRLQIKNFKRFSDLTIDLSQANDPRLVLLIGANGCGKSSIMDVFQWIKTWWLQDKDYYAKNKDRYPEVFLETDQWSFEQKNQWSYPHTGDRSFLMDKIYCRSSVRIVPQPQRKNYNEKSYEQDAYWPKHSIMHDERFHVDLEHYVTLFYTELQKPVFSWEDNFDIRAIREQYIGKFNRALQRVFGTWKTSISLVDIENMAQNRPANLYFKKWTTEKLSYHLLSHGEKQVVILLLNFLIQQDNFADSILFVDEMDNHLHTSLQYNLIQEIVEHRLPEWSQLWTASHALWFIDYAKDSEDAVLIDFDSYDFDEQKVLEPVDTSDPSQHYMHIGLTPWIISLLTQSIDHPLVFSEGKNYEILHKAYDFFGGNDTITINDGWGKNEMKTFFSLLAKNNFSRFVCYFLFDCDAVSEYEVCKAQETAYLKAILLPQNDQNTIIKQGIENMFPEYLFDPQYDERSHYYHPRETRWKYGEQWHNEKFDKQAFADYIIQKNDQADFMWFKDVVGQIV